MGTSLAFFFLRRHKAICSVFISFPRKGPQRPRLDTPHVLSCSFSFRCGTTVPQQETFATSHSLSLAFFIFLPNHGIGDPRHRVPQCRQHAAHVHAVHLLAAHSLDA